MVSAAISLIKTIRLLGIKPIMISNKTILIAAAHPDDEVLGCGGTIAKYSKENDIHIAIFGEGITSRFDKRSDADAKELVSLQNQSREAGEFLGAKTNFFFSLPDNRFDSMPFLEIVKKAEEVLEKIKPEIIYTHHPSDLNIDHRILFQAILTAARPIFGNFVKEIYSFEVPSSTEWSFQKMNGFFSPNVFENISETIEKKIKCMEIYESEIKKFPHPRSAEALLAIARRWGSVAGLQNAEAFELIRGIR